MPSEVRMNDAPVCIGAAATQRENGAVEHLGSKRSRDDRALVICFKACAVAVVQHEHKAEQQVVDRAELWARQAHTV